MTIKNGEMSQNLNNAGYVLWFEVKNKMMKNPVYTQTLNLIYIPSDVGELVVEDSSVIHKEKEICVTYNKIQFTFI